AARVEHDDVRSSALDRVHHVREPRGARDREAAAAEEEARDPDEAAVRGAEKDADRSLGSGTRWPGDERRRRLDQPKARAGPDSPVELDASLSRSHTYPVPTVPVVSRPMRSTIAGRRPPARRMKVRTGPTFRRGGAGRGVASGLARILARAACVPPS